MYNEGMARLLVEIDEELKRELKVRLVREGITLKTWLTRAAEEYTGFSASSATRNPRADRGAASSAASMPATPRRPRHDDYLD